MDVIFQFLKKPLYAPPLQKKCVKLIQWNHGKVKNTIYLKEWQMYSCLKHTHTSARAFMYTQTVWSKCNN